MSEFEDYVAADVLPLSFFRLPRQMQCRIMLKRQEAAPPPRDALAAFTAKLLREHWEEGAKAEALAPPIFTVR